MMMMGSKENREKKKATTTLAPGSQRATAHDLTMGKGKSIQNNGRGDGHVASSFFRKSHQP